MRATNGRHWGDSCHSPLRNRPLHPSLTNPRHTPPMRRIAFLFPLLALLGGCFTGHAPAPQPHYLPPTHTRPPPLAFAPPPAEERECLANLATRQANFTPIPDQYFGAGCSTINSVRLLSLRSDSADLRLTNLGPVTCHLANVFAGWARFGVDRAARQIMGSPLARVETMGSYTCRNVAGTDHLSAHASGNAIDVSGFVLADGRRITVLGDWNAGDPNTRAFLQTVHLSACKRFGTVLGPSYNSAHHNHFHVEVSAIAFCR